MAKIDGEIVIGRPVEEVFDFVADSRNEPQYNPAIRSAELLTALPIGVGTRFRACVGRAGALMLVELTEFDRPHRLGSRTISSMIQTSGVLTFAADGGGTVMRWDWQVRPKGWMRMLGPLFGPLDGRMEQSLDQHEAILGAHRGPARNPAHTLARSWRASPDVLGEKPGPAARSPPPRRGGRRATGR